MKSITSVVLLFIVLQVSERKMQVLSCGQLGTVLVNRLTRTHTTHRWPWHVAIYHQIGHGSSYQCGGTLINSNAILTAAHCVRVETERVTVSLGRLYLDGDDAPFVKVAQIIPHPDYSEEYQENDIAIILLSTRATYNNYVQPVCLWSVEETGFSEIVGKYGTVVGWGRTETGELSNTLQEASFPVATTIDCLKSNRALFGLFLSDTNFCAGTRNGTSVCTGDSGGSMTFETNGRYYIRGIVSVGPSKKIIETSQIVCDPMQYALFTDVVPYVPWIQRLVKIVECETIVRCSWSRDMHQCTAAIQRNTIECQIIFNEISNPVVTELAISGKSDVIPDLADAVSKFANLDTLVVTNLLVKEVQRGRLIPFSNITKLDLSLNEISQFDAPDTFNDLTNLEELHISFNQLTVLPAGIFRSNRKMRELSLSANRLKELHADQFNGLYSLETLSLSNNKLETLPVGLFHGNGKLQLLTLSYNQLRELHSDLFKELPILEDITLNGNQLESIPSGLFRNNRVLKSIRLENNKIKKIEPDFNRMTLWILDLSENVCISDRCGGYTDSCYESNLLRIFDKIKQNC